MRTLQLAVVSALLSSPLPAPLIPGPNLAKRVELAESIVVAKVVSGTTRGFGSQVSSDIVLHVNRVLKGDLIPGTDVAAHLEGRGYFVVPTVKQSTITDQLYGIWFLGSTSRPYTVISRDGTYGEIHFAPVLLPEGAPAGSEGEKTETAVANELAAALLWIAQIYPAQLRPDAQRNRTPEQRTAAGRRLSQFHSLVEDFRTLNSSATHAIYEQFAKEKSIPIRLAGIEGLIRANDPEGVKRAAMDWDDFASAADIQPLISSLMSYSNADDEEAVRALGALSIRDPAEPGLRQSTVYALRAIHSKQALPALIALLDDKEDRVRSYALSGLCLYVRNAPTVTPESVPSMSWLQSRPPTPLLNPETQRYCLLGGMIDRATQDVYVSFWKSWWNQHQVEIQGN